MLPLMSEAAVPRPGCLTQRIPWSAQVCIILKNDVSIELRTGELLVTTAFFGFLVVVIASLSFFDLDDETLNAQIAGGAIWCSTVFSSILSLSRSWAREKSEGALDALLLSPIAHSAIFMGKTLALCAFLLAVELVIVPTASLLFNLDLIEYGPQLALVVLLAVPGIAASGTLFGVMTVRGKAGALVLGVVLIPLLSPTVLAAAIATRSLLDGTPLGELTAVLMVMVVFNLVFTAGGLSLFGAVADSG